MPISLVADLIRSAMVELNALASGDVPSQEEYNDGLDTLNEMLQGYATDESMLPRRFYSTFTVSTSGVTIGPTGTLVTTGRVVKLLGAVLRYTSAGQIVDRPLSIREFPDYQMIQNKSVSAMPCTVYLNPGAVSNGTLYFDRVPDQSYTLLLDTQEQFGDYLDVSSSINLAPEYKPMLKWNLAVALSNQYPGLTPFIVAEAKRSRERIQYINYGYLMPETRPSSDLIV